MNWYKHALIKTSLSRVHRPDRKNIDKKRLQLFNLLKSYNVKHTFYHGTSSKIYEDIKKTGYLFSPRALGSSDREKRNKGLDQVFYTTSLNYARYYSKRAAQQTDSNEIILKLEIPIHLITEIKNSILYPTKEIYNEYNLNKIFRNILRNKDNKKAIEEIIDNELFQPSTEDNEFTTFFLLPSKYIVEVFPIVNNKMIGGSVVEWEQILRNDILDIDSMPEDVRNHPKIKIMLYNFWLKKIKYNPFPYFGKIPEEIFNDDFFQEVYYDSIKSKLLYHPERFNDLPVELKKNKEIIKSTIRDIVRLSINMDGSTLDNLLPEELKKYPEIQQARLKSWARQISPDGYEEENKIPVELRQEPLIQQARLIGWIESLNREWMGEEDDYALKKYIDSIPEDLKNNPKIQEAQIEGWAFALKYRTLEYSEMVPENLKNNPKIQEALIEGWASVLNSSEIPNDLFGFEKRCPEEIKQKIFEIRINSWKEMISYFPQIYDDKYFPADLKNNPEIQNIINQKKINAKNNWFKKAQNNFKHDNNLSDETNIHTISTPAGRIQVMENSPWAGNRNSVIEFVVDEDKRGQGIGSSLVQELMSYYKGKNMSAQVSSLASLRVFYSYGFRPISNLSASYEESIKLFKENWGSLMMVKDNNELV
jgi:ribosomal protein S18 acetylase RimI-like enzyme